MKKNSEIINQNSKMTNVTGNLLTPKWDPRTRKWIFPKNPKDIKKSPYDF